MSAATTTTPQLTRALSTGDTGFGKTPRKPSGRRRDAQCFSPGCCLAVRQEGEHDLSANEGGFVHSSGDVRAGGRPAWETENTFASTAVVTERLQGELGHCDSKTTL